MEFVDLKEKLSNLNGDDSISLTDPTYSLVLSNRNKKVFRVSLQSIVQTLIDIRTNLSFFSNANLYNEKIWRDLSEHFTSPEIQTLSTVQTKPFFSGLNRILTNFSNTPFSDDSIDLTEPTLNVAISELEKLNNDLSSKTSKKKDSYPLKKGRNIIVYGAPGTGKSNYFKNKPNIFRTVFHSDYQNSDFIGSYRPHKDGGNITYEFIPGPFIKAFVMAVNNPKDEVNLIIEEINRGNCASIFGEVFQLLDRDENGESEYKVNVDEACFKYLQRVIEDKDIASLETCLYIPKNLNLLATMNSSDQGVAPLDSAFKRRWEFIFKPIIFNLDEHKHLLTEFIFCNGQKYSFSDFALAINEILSREEIDEDRHLGQFFMNRSEINDVENNKQTFTGKVLLYLWDDVLRHTDRSLVFNSEKFKTLSSLINGYLNGEMIFSSGFDNEIINQNAKRKLNGHKE